VIAASVTDATKTGIAAIKVSTGTAEVTPASLDFGTHRKFTATWLHVTLSNAGTTPLAISDISISGSPTVGSGTTFSETNTCVSRVRTGASCDITVEFHPFGTGDYHAVLVIKDGSPDSPQQVPLTGQGCKACSNREAVRGALARETLVTAPLPTGPNRVGTRIVDLVDDTRTDPFETKGGKREVLVRFWYPTSDHGGCRPAPYTDPAVWEIFSELLIQPLPTVQTNSCLDAPTRDGAYPVVVFTHGYTGTFTDDTFLFEDLASRGYIVASVEHSHEATAVAYPDGRIVKSLFGSHLNETGDMDSATLDTAESARLSDVRFVVGELTRLSNNAASPFAGHLDTSSVAVAGHSFGALTALQAVQQDARIRAAVLIDGVVIERALAPTDKPVLLLDSGRPQWSQDERHLWDTLHGARYAVNLVAGEHLTPTDAVWLAPGAIHTGRMSPEQSVAAIRAYIAAFLDAHLLGRPVDPLLVRESLRYPNVDVRGP